jgi:hypothetical protein
MPKLGGTTLLRRKDRNRSSTVSSIVLEVAIERDDGRPWFQLANIGNDEWRSMSWRPNGFEHQLRPHRPPSQRAAQVAVRSTCARRLIGIAQMRLYDCARVRAADHRHELESRSEATPSQHPLLQQPQVVALHELKTSSKIRLHPTVDVSQAIGKPPTIVAKSSVDWNHVVVLESLDDHE